MCCFFCLKEEQKTTAFSHRSCMQPASLPCLALKLERGSNESQATTSAIIDVVSANPKSNDRYFYLLHRPGDASFTNAEGVKRIIKSGGVIPKFFVNDPFQLYDLTTKEFKKVPQTRPDHDDELLLRFISEFRNFYADDPNDYDRRKVVDGQVAWYYLNTYQGTEVLNLASKDELVFRVPEEWLRKNATYCSEVHVNSMYPWAMVTTLRLPLEYRIDDPTPLPNEEVRAMSERDVATILIKEHGGLSNHHYYTHTAYGGGGTSAPYYEVKMQELEKQMAVMQRRLKALECSKLPQKNPDQEEKRRKFREKNVQRIKDQKYGLEYWNGQDFSKIEMPSAKKLFEFNKPSQKFYEWHIKGYDLPASLLYPVFESEAAKWEEQDKEDQDDAAGSNDAVESMLFPTNLREQSELLEDAYKEYVNKTTEEFNKSSGDSIIQLWTSEADKFKTYAPPHEKIEYVLLQRSKLYKESKDSNDAIPSLNTSDTVDVLRQCVKLYDLVVNAPRCPQLMLFSRSVRRTARLPSEYFRRIHNQEMKPGQSVRLPNFMSTSTLTMETNFQMFGSGNYTHVDTHPEEEACCMIRVFVPAGVPILPVFMYDEHHNQHQYENEVLLPPGVELVMLETVGEFLLEDDTIIDIYSYIARIGEPDLLVLSK